VIAQCPFESARSIADARSKRTRPAPAPIMASGCKAVYSPNLDQITNNNNKLGRSL
jgi:hypothetical protein